jgi:hypothetical protein
MAASDLSGNTLPAGFAASYIRVMLDIVGRHGTDAVLRRSGLEAWIGKTDASLAEVPLDFVQNSALLKALEETLGARGVRGLGRRMGAAAFERVLRPSSAVAAMHDPGFQAYPVARRLRAGLYGVVRTLGAISSVAATIREEGTGIVCRVEACPDCWGRSSSVPCCGLLLGIVTAGCAWIAPEAPVRVAETLCKSLGGPACEFSIHLEAGG